ncbi:MAG: acetyl-CoA decarbonylase/synthase complex subunit gamma [Candidatus Omnitrophota bacterium]|nr:acetyl-CoA decarbonylase/synthase complex subunit gamma [Candidatus Omnitrophota bacterium]
MPLSGLDIYKLLPKTNCRECGFATCLAFAMQLAKKTVGIDKCPYLTEESKRTLEASSLPPIKLVTIGTRSSCLEIGNETVMFRHEEKFHHPCLIGIIIEDNLTDNQIKSELEKINNLKFERIGQKLEISLLAIKQNSASARFIEVVKLISSYGYFNLTLMSNEEEALKGALEITKDKKTLIYSATGENLSWISKLALTYHTPLVVSGQNIECICSLTEELSRQGINDLVIDTGKKSIPEKIWDLTQIRRQALKKSNRSLGYPTLTIIEQDNPYDEAIEAATYISKYAQIILIKGFEAWKALSLLTLRQNIYSDPQKPLQIEPKLYPVGQVTDKSPVLVTTNFSLTYYTVLGEVEASKVPSYIIIVNTEGMSVLTAWAAEKFTPEKITESINKFAIRNTVSHNRLIIPGYVAVMSTDLEEKSGYQILVGPKEATGLPSFLKTLSSYAME